MSSKKPMTHKQVRALKQYAEALGKETEWGADQAKAAGLSPWQLEVLRVRILIAKAEKVARINENYEAAGIDLASLSDPIWVEGVK